MQIVANTAPVNRWPVAGKLVAVGDEFGRLTVTKVYREKARLRLVCRCVCGTVIKVQARHVVRGTTKSCGCYGRAMRAAINRDLRRKPLGEASFNNLYGQYRATAKKLNREFSLTKEQFRALTKRPCHYCGTPPAQEHCAGYGAYRYNGIDRVDNEKGYTPQNSTTCCFRCNRAKGTSTAEEFTNWLNALVVFRQTGTVDNSPTTRHRYFKPQPKNQ